MYGCFTACHVPRVDLHTLSYPTSFRVEGCGLYCAAYGSSEPFNDLREDVYACGIDALHLYRCGAGGRWLLQHDAANVPIHSDRECVRVIIVARWHRPRVGDASSGGGTRAHMVA